MDYLPTSFHCGTSVAVMYITASILLRVVPSSLLGKWDLTACLANQIEYVYSTVTLQLAFKGEKKNST
jgi:hypothetical protein